ncbi:MAG: TolC family protein, partial [Candidatus Tectomicrobia bacterium]|nr:TolC family protein [Candidatus Tectomicrobia bacterium]
MPKPFTAHWLMRGLGTLIMPLAIALVGPSCASLPDLPEMKPMQHVPPAPGEASTPQSNQEPSAPRSSLQATLQRPSALPADALPGVSPALQAATTSNGLTLPQLVDEALRINLTTRHAWEHARVAATTWALSRGSYYPTITGTAFGGVAEANGQSLKGIDAFDRQSFGGAELSLEYLLFDFGGRSAQAQAARQALIAAKWNHNQAIQDVLRNVAQAYYTLLGANAQLAATEISLADAQTGLDAAQARLKAGAGTLPEKLQAQAQVERVRFELEAARGQVAIIRGKLATAVGWPANTPFTVAAEPGAFPLAAIAKNVEQLIAQAQRNRPDLAAFRSAIEQQEAKVRKAKSALYPKITA